MLLNAILIGLIGAISQLESRIMGEIKLSQPIVTGLLVGIVLGDIKTGVILGAQFQLVWMGVSGVGATPMMDVGLGSTLGTAFAIMSGTGIEVALTLALPIALLSQYINVFIRTTLNAFMHKADKYAQVADMRGMARIHWFGASLFFLLGFIPCFCGILFGSDAVNNVVKAIPEFIIHGLNAASKIFPALGFALLMQVTITKKLIPYFIFGFVISAYLSVDVTGIAIIGAGVALLVFQMMSDQKPQTDELEDIL
ncbi:PTS mannose/fructose/sorbose/N-acetylgalactosamine transporter subunit IIC [Enterococcus avium]|uniref:PTS mannose/fructose/sorbose/N-acetylgalactosamine transporter subunit IIC n=1 Tax=Enterococcus avium TaxID=33945 RepID=UPI0022E5BBA7|nr:PTS sugar transporter subunit IIC [Enterococcus avium]